MLLLLALCVVAGTASSEWLAADKASCAAPVAEHPWAPSPAQCLASADSEDEYTSAMQVSLHMALGEARGQPAPVAAGPEPSALGAVKRAAGGAEDIQLGLAGSSPSALASAGGAGVSVMNSSASGPIGHLLDPVESVAVPFVTVTAQGDPGRNATIIKVHIAGPSSIISTYIFLYGPAIIAWMAFLYAGCPEWLYRLVLPVTLCTMSMGMHLVNQSLAALMDAPVAIMCVQSAFLCLVAGVWSLFSEIDSPSLGRHLLAPMAMWAGVAAMFTVNQMLSHLVSYESSLCERVVFMNLCPVLSHFVEEAADATKLGKAGARNQARPALAVIVLGAVLFSVQLPDVTFTGLAWVCLLMAQAVPFHLLQRLMLVRWPALPIPVLACYDAAFLLVASFCISTSRQDHLWESWQHWTSHSSILCMLALSMLIFCGYRFCELALLRVSTASNVLIYKNIANIVTAALAVVIFGEQAWSSPCAVVGIFISLAGGVWYAIETAQLAGAKEADGEDARLPVLHEPAAPPAAL